MDKIMICADRKHPPFEYINDEGEIEGFNIDVTNAIAKTMDLNIEIHLLEWQDAIEGMDTGGYDIIQGMSVSGDRESKYVFGPKYITASHSVFALKEREDIKDVVGFANKKSYCISAQKNDAGLFILDEKKVMRDERYLIKVSDQEKALKLLKDKKSDLVVGNKLTLLYYAKKLNIEDEIKLIGNPLRLTKYGMAFKEKDKILLRKFNDGMERIIESGEYEDIYNSWFGSSDEDYGRQIIENVEVGVIYIDKLGRVTAINNFAKNILNLTKDEAIFKSFYETKISDIFNISIIQKILDNMEDYLNSEIKIEIKNEIRYIEVNYSKLLDTKNGLMGVLINFKDITEKRKLERILVRHDKMESLGVLLLNMAHELRNPLTSIKNFVELIPDHIDDDEFRESLLYHVPTQINYINSLFSTLLEYSKPREANIVNLNIKELVESHLIKSINKFIDKDIEINIDIDEDFYIEADQNQMKQIFINLITNSMEAIEESGIINIYTVEDENEDEKRIYIEDDGIGVTVKDIDKIFDPFFTKREDGIGLGLFITYNLMKENSGSIEFTSLEIGTRVALIFEKKGDKNIG